MKIGTVSIHGKAALAPMAGVGDRAFRETCVQHGAAYVVSEMVSAKGLVYNSRGSRDLVVLSADERPAAIQLFGDDPAVMQQAVELVLPFQPEILDLNMGCPAPKIAGDGSGAALMKNLPLAERLIAAVVARSPVPVTVKIRTGWDSGHLNAVEAAKRAEAAGASAVAVHGRTRMQMYAPPVDLETIRKVKEAVSIPVIGNGGIETPQQAKEMYEQTGCDLIMIAQGALGRPWIFDQISTYLATGTLPPEPSLMEKLQILREQIARAICYKGEYRALREARTHAAWYLRGMRGAAHFRALAGKLETIQDLDGLAAAVLAAQSSNNIS